MRPCIVCHIASSSQFNFSLQCIVCAVCVHHRCHDPPVSDSDLLSIIQAYTKEQGLQWTCGGCAARAKAKVDVEAVAKAPANVTLLDHINAHHKGDAYDRHPRIAARRRRKATPKHLERRERDDAKHTFTLSFY